MWTNPAWSEPVQGYQSSSNSYQPVYSTQYAADPARFLQQSTQAGPQFIYGANFVPGQNGKSAQNYSKKSSTV